MDAQLLGLQAELDLVRAQGEAEYEKLLVKLDEILDKYFIQPYNAKCIRRWTREGFDADSKDYFLCFDIGFYNSEENRIDFGSDISFEYRTLTNELRLNYGTCGYFSKDNTYQFMRAILIAGVYKNIEEIENALNVVGKAACDMLTPINRQRWDIEWKIRDIERQIRSDERKSIEVALKAGDTLVYKEDCLLYQRDRLFRTKVEITHTTPKFVDITDNYSKVRIRKNTLVDHIHRGFIEWHVVS